MLNSNINTNVGNDGEVADGLYDDHPPIDGIGLDGQDAFFEIDDLIFGGMEADNTSNEHHSIGEW